MIGDGGDGRARAVSNDSGTECAPSALRFAYADPPYVGQSKRHYGHHKDYAGEVDQRALVERLIVEFPDGWALSLSMKSLPAILPMCPPDVLILAWVKPNTSPPMGDHRHYSWEPLILHGGRRPHGATVWTHLIANVEQYTFREKPADYVVGAKPDAFCHWLFRHAGLGPDDELVDLFPGSGAVQRAWETFKNDLRLAV